jgi:hypothetical protein
MQSSNSSLTPCLIESLRISEDGTGKNPYLPLKNERKPVDVEFHDHEMRWTEMSEEISFLSALRYLRIRMFIDRDMAVILDESYLHHFALALYRYRSGDVDESSTDKQFMNRHFYWDETAIDSSSISSVRAD